MPADHLLRQPEIRLESLAADGAVHLAISETNPSIDLMSAETAVKYAGYLRRQEQEIEHAKRNERRKIPARLLLHRHSRVDAERLFIELTQVRPDTLGQAMRIPGVTPAAVAVLFQPHFSVFKVSVEELRRRLIDRSVPLNVTLATPQVDQLQTYFELLVRWNRRINLTALPLEPLGDETLDRLFIEPLVAARHVQASPLTWFDLGSGGGSPAVPCEFSVRKPG